MASKRDLLMEATGCSGEAAVRAIRLKRGDFEAARSLLERIEASRQFVLWRDDHNDFIAFLHGGFDNWEDNRALNRGVSVAAKWHSRVRNQMSSERGVKKYDRLGDNMAASPPVVSKRLKERLEQLVGEEVELLPIGIRDMSGKTKSLDYFVVNPVGLIDCIDLEASNVEWNTLDSTLITRCDGLFLDESAVPDDVSMFRAEHSPHNIIVRRALAATLLRAGLTGLWFPFACEFDGTGYNGPGLSIEDEEG